MNRLLYPLLFVLTGAVYAQDTLTPVPEITPEMRKMYRKNQHEIDMNHGGIGLMFYKPAFGSLVTQEKHWVGVNVLSDIFEAKFGVGINDYEGEIPYGFTSTEYVKGRDFGYQLSIGANVPINALTFGAQRSPRLVFRGHPVIAGEIGVFGMTNVNNYQNRPSNSIWYFGINPGYRIRIPQGSVEFNVNARLGITTGNSDIYKGLGLYPSLTFRLDALKWRYNPSMVSVPASLTTVSNIQSTTTYNGTRYNADGSSVSYYTTYTTADVTVTPFNAGIQDIGPHFGIGPKVSLMNPKRTPYVPKSFLVGIVAEGRGGPLDVGFTLEGGKVGHGSELRGKSDPGKYRKQLDKGETFGQGTINTANAYVNLGMDISPFFLALAGIAIDKGESTSFMTTTAGLIFGGHVSWGQEYLDPTVQTEYDLIVQKDAGVSKPKFLDPSAAKSGYLGGFYFSMQVGAMEFKVTNYRYYGAPFASNTLLSLAYRFPLIRQ